MAAWLEGWDRTLNNALAIGGCLVRTRHAPHFRHMVNYSQHGPPADLRNWIRLIWTLRIDTNAPGDAEPVIPDGCSELIFNLGDPCEQRALGEANFRIQSGAIINGQLHSAISLRSLGAVRLVGVRLQPWALGSLMNMPAHLLTDRWESLQSISAHLMPDLHEHLMRCHESESHIDIVAHHLRSLLRNRRAPDSRLRRLVRGVEAIDSLAGIRRISDEIGLSERTLQRLFANEVGLGAKQFSKVLRVQRVVRLRQSGGATTWARAALDAGYYDQAHFNKDFQTVVGCAPTSLIVEPHSFTDAFMKELPER